VVILLVGVEMAAKVVDPSRDERHLNWGAPTVTFVELVLLDEVVLDDRHGRRASARVCAAGEANAVN
jgi:hypothetical protein